MTSRERMLATLACQAVDHTPCCFMMFFNLRRKCRDEAEFVQKQMELGLDTYTHAGYLNTSCHPDVKEKIWVEQKNSEQIFCRQLDTPKGPLIQRVVQKEGWPTAKNYHLYNDLIIPRSREFLIKPEMDLEKLPYVFGPTRDEDIRKLRDSAAVAQKLAQEHQIIQAGGWTSYNSLVNGDDDGIMGADCMSWLSGFMDVMTLSLENPDLIREYMRLIHEWNLKRIGIYLDVTAADIIFRRAWYETTEFWTPSAYNQIIHPFLKKEVELVHQAGRKFGLITTSAFAPLLDDILDTGIDVLIGVDPEQGKGTDLAQIKIRFAEKKRALWGGVSGALTVEQGTVLDTEQAVQHALEVLDPGNCFILSPVDNVREETPQVWENTRVLIQTWKDLCKDK